MKYFEAEFVISPLSADATDLLAAIAGEAGFESFEETPTGLKGYVQQQLFDQSALQTALTDFPFDQVDITYTIREAEDRDWNEQWEQEGFEPITVNNTIVIHDGRHLPTEEISHLSPLIEIEIDAHLAFGTGTHETTRMICSTLLSHLSPLTTHHSPLRVLDCGTGTGILSICALKLGATEAVGYDIDEWSVDNARHNAVINCVDDRFTSLLGDASILNKVEGTFDLVLANINRNILLADMPAFRQKMAPGATLILSGFYTADSPMLIDKAASLDLTLQQQKEDHDWACLVFS
jgi:ribosomal protein L11 methyltransferase